MTSQGPEEQQQPTDLVTDEELRTLGVDVDGLGALRPAVEVVREAVRSGTASERRAAAAIVRTVERMRRGRVEDPGALARALLVRLEPHEEAAALARLDRVRAQARRQAERTARLDDAERRRVLRVGLTLRGAADDACALAWLRDHPEARREVEALAARARGTLALVDVDDAPADEREVARALAARLAERPGLAVEHVAAAAVRERHEATGAPPARRGRPLRERLAGIGGMDPARGPAPVAGAVRAVVGDAREATA